MSGMQQPLKTHDDQRQRAARLQRYMHDQIPLVRHMHVHVAHFDGRQLSLSAPLAPNINHEQTAFGGSLVSLATLSCWGLLWLLLEDQEQLRVVVTESHMRYLYPVTGELQARCSLPGEDSVRKFLQTLARRDKARLELSAEIVQEARCCSRFEGSFVAYRRPGT